MDFERSKQLLPLAVLAAAGLAGCVSETDLEPAAAANEAAGSDAAVSRVEGVRVRTQAVDWPGSVDIDSEVTPIQVTIENESGEPLALRYQELALVEPQGRQYSALPPFEMQQSVGESVVVNPLGTPLDPGFSWTGFTAAPYFSGIYTDPFLYPDPFFYDPLYYDETYTYWASIDLPTQEMLEQALPEGVIEDGGEVQGWVYFEKVPEDIPRVTFRADLINAQTGEQFGEIRIPYLVQQE